MKHLSIILGFVLPLIFPNLSLAQAPNLGTASNYALFTVTGAFSNTGATVVNGDIGTNAGALTGFPPGTVFGTTNVANAASQQAANDVIAANNDLTASICTAAITASIGGLTLTPGVYCQSGPASASDLTGVLTLDGGGDPNALFIIKLTGALSTATGSSIVLTNGASFENVYFQVDGAVNVGIGSVFRGTVLANGAISLLTGASLQGRALSIAGAINTDNNNVNGFPDLTPVILSNSGTYNKGQSRDLVIKILNKGSVPTSGPVVFYIPKTDPTFTIAIDAAATAANVSAAPSASNPDWTFVDQGSRYEVTLKSGFSIPASGGSKQIVITLTATGNKTSEATVSAQILNGTGGAETPTSNNIVTYKVSINL